MKRLRTFLENDELDPNTITWREDPAIGDVYNYTCSAYNHVHKLCEWVSALHVHVHIHVYLTL